LSQEPEQRDETLIALERQVRASIRDAVNRQSRKPFYWGGLKGYEQLQAIAQVLNEVPEDEAETDYLRRLAMQVNRVVDKNQTQVQDLREAHCWLRRIAHCLRYPADPEKPLPTSHQVKRDMEALLEDFQPDYKRQPAQARLHRAWHHAWETYGEDLLACYDIPGLPQDNLALEALFGRLRNHQRRISGRASTRPLRDFGQHQVLFLAESEAQLRSQIQEVPYALYLQQRRLLDEAEEPRRFLHRLHRNPLATINSLIDQHTLRRTALADCETTTFRDD
jgi:hypothetical protein